MSLNLSISDVKRYLPVIVVGIALVLAAEWLGFWAGMDSHFYDLFFRLRGPAEPDNRILIGVIDEPTLKRLGRWPLRRLHYARLLDRLEKASVVGLDILLVEPSDDDRVLAEAIGKHGRVVLAAYVMNPFEIGEPVLSLPARGVGHVHLEQDIDGVVRRVYQSLYAGGRRLPSFASAIRETLTGQSVPHRNPAGQGRDLTTQARIVQMDPLRINYYGPPGTFPRLSLVDILDGRYPADFFTDRIVLIGVAAPGLEAGVLTPFTQHRDQMNGVEAHAHILSNLLDRNSVVEVSETVRWGASIGLSLMAFFIFVRGTGRWAALSWVTGILLAALAAFGSLAFFNVWFIPVVLCLLLSLMFVTAYIFRLDQGGRALGEAKQMWEESFNTINDAIVLMDGAGSIVKMNLAAKAMLDSRMLDLLSRRSCLPQQTNSGGAKEQGPGKAAVEAGQSAGEEIADPLTGRHFEIQSLYRNDPQSPLGGFVHVVRDITARVKAEQEKERLQFLLLQAQKMQSIGRLAGGVAHDFNNILTAILGYSEMALMRLSKEDDLWGYIRIINDSGLKAAALTRQLLAFSRRQVMELHVVNLREIVAGMAKILNRIIGEDVTLKFKTEKPLLNILVDPVQVEQVIMNLVVNARDAMPTGGTMTIETADVELDENYAATHEGLAPGSYVMLAVTDTGEGMSPEVRSRIFEPFFTTKGLGEGTGLGLSTVYGIVKQMSGAIDVFSEQGKGSIFKVYLPVCREKPEEQELTGPVDPAGGDETVLVAEDDDIIRTIVREFLEPLGYRVIVARSGEEAMELLGKVGPVVDILLTDVVMPGMGGKELAQRFQEISPRSKVLFMSGYTGDVVIRHGVEQGNVDFIQKPLVPNKLVRKIREVLDRR